MTYVILYTGISIPCKKKKKLKVKNLYLKSSFDDWKLRRIKHNSLNISLLRTIIPHYLVLLNPLDLVNTRLHSENAVRRSIYPYVSKYNYVSVRNTRVKYNFLEFGHLHVLRMFHTEYLWVKSVQWPGNKSLCKGLRLQV